MNRNNVLRATRDRWNLRWILPPVFQHDHGLSVFFPGLTTEAVHEIQFANREISMSVGGVASEGDLGIVAPIPDLLLRQPYDVICYLYYGRTDIAQEGADEPTFSVGDTFDLTVSANDVATAQQFRVVDGSLYFDKTGDLTYTLTPDMSIVSIADTGYTVERAVIPMIARPA